MAADEGTCPYCGIANLRSRTHCNGCNEELPWAAWVRAARGGEPAPVGSVAKSEVELRDRSLDAGGALSSGSMIRLATIAGPIILMMVVGYFVLRNVSAPLKEATKGPGGNALTGGNAVEQFKKANPAIGAKDEQ